MATLRKLRPCPCGNPAVWWKQPPDPDQDSDGNVCLLTDADFTDDYCDTCFARLALPPRELAKWQRLPDSQGRLRRS